MNKKLNKDGLIDWEACRMLSPDGYLCCHPAGHKGCHQARFCGTSDVINWTDAEGHLAEESFPITLTPEEYRRLIE